MRTGCPRGSALQVELSLDLEVGTADLVLESLVEQVLDALLVLAAPAGDERQRGKQQQGGEATHAAQDSGRTRAACALDRNPSPSSCL